MILDKNIWQCASSEYKLTAAPIRTLEIGHVSKGCLNQSVITFNYLFQNSHQKLNIEFDDIYIAR